MHTFRNKILYNFHSTEFYKIFNFKDDLAVGRTCFFVSAIITTIVNTLTTGIFYTGFLLLNGIDIVNIGFLGAIPYLTSLFSLFTPAILNRVHSRRKILRYSRILFYSLNIAGITIVPLLHLPTKINYILFVIFVFLSNTIKFTFESGFSSWQAHFLPEEVRANFFSFQQITNGILSAITIMISGIITDSVKHSEHQLYVMTALRFIAFVLAVLECIIITSPKEFEEKNTELSLHSILTIPFHHKEFLITMIFVFLWNFGTMIGLTSYDVYILGTVGINYTTISVINASYSLFLLCFTPFWKKFLRKYGWLKTFALTALMHAPTIFLNGFVNPTNYMWLYVSMRLTQHFVGVGLNLSFANLSLLYLPKTDQTNCLSFYLIVLNLGAFLGQMLGSSILANTADFSLDLFGYTYTNVILVTSLESIVLLVTAFLVLKFGRSEDKSIEKKRKIDFMKE